MTSLHSLWSPSSTSHVHLSPGLLQQSPNWFPGFHSGFLSFLSPPEYYLFKIQKCDRATLLYIISHWLPNALRIKSKFFPWSLMSQPPASLASLILGPFSLLLCSPHSSLSVGSTYYLCSSNILALLSAAQTQGSSSHTLPQCPSLPANPSPPCVPSFFSIAHHNCMTCSVLVYLPGP